MNLCKENITGDVGHGNIQKDGFGLTLLEERYYLSGILTELEVVDSHPREHFGLTGEHRFLVIHQEYRQFGITSGFHGHPPSRTGFFYIGTTIARAQWLVNVLLIALS
jgi:hypothetical protein